MCLSSSPKLLLIRLFRDNAFLYRTYACQTVKHKLQTAMPLWGNKSNNYSRYYSQYVVYKSRAYNNSNDNDNNNTISPRQEEPLSCVSEGAAAASIQKYSKQSHKSIMNFHNNSEAQDSKRRLFHPIPSTGIFKVAFYRKQASLRQTGRQIDTRYRKCMPKAEGVAIIVPKRLE